MAQQTSPHRPLLYSEPRPLCKCITFFHFDVEGNGGDGRDLVILLSRIWHGGGSDGGGCGGSGGQEVSGPRDKSINILPLCSKITMHILLLMRVSDFTRTRFCYLEIIIA